MNKIIDLLVMGSIITCILLLRLILSLELLGIYIYIITLLIQGYLLIAVLFPYQKIYQTPLIFLIPFIGIAISSLLYLLISYTVGFTIDHYYIGLLTFVLLLIIVILIRRNNFTEDNNLINSIYPKKLQIRFEWILLSIAIISFMVLMVYSRTTNVRYSEFYLINENGQFGNYTKTIKLGENLNLSYIVANHSKQQINYELYYEENNESPKIIVEFNVTMESLRSNNLSIPINNPGLIKITLILIEKDQPTNQYQLIYWVTVN